MSVDDRIRSAFAETDDTWESRVDEALRDIRRRHTRGIVGTPREPPRLAAAAAVVAGAVLVTGHGPGGEAAPDPVGPPSPPTRERESEPFAVTVLQGRVAHRTPLDEDALRQALSTRPATRRSPTGSCSGLPAAPFRLVWDGRPRHRAAAARCPVGGPTVLDELAVVVDGGHA